ncbi:type VI secretion system ImpA family N-terminal domain-containing protein [uncultured Ruegeria sp.]|uniref:type VI secretion system protein TssA n=1 Tax=uncultured Ruegeria sp. TaxID=259304 RepID=UPI00261B8906|nr:type VI secretion system ImpA family N-terminal domain-containing protein [uncultured Ruegeria sp.]
MDFEVLLEPLEGDNPSGAELRNDPRFHAIERLLETAAKTNRVLPDGTLNPSALPTDWSSIENDGLELAKTGRDLRMLNVLIRARVASDSFEGLSAGLKMLDTTLDTYWDNLNPPLRDRDTPHACVQPRQNAIKQLENDDNGLLGDLKFSIALSPRGIGPLTGEDLAAATLSVFDAQARYTGATEAELADIATKHEARIGRVKAGTRALAAEEPERAEALVTTLKQAQETLGSICTRFNASAGYEKDPGLNLKELGEFLGQVQTTLEVAMSDMSDAADDSAAPTPQPQATPQAAAPATAPAGTAAPGAVSSRADVERCLDGIIAFYERTEPSSPIPHLARRLRRMVPMDFMDLMEEVAPSGLKEFRNVAGVEDAKGRKS